MQTVRQQESIYISHVPFPLRIEQMNSFACNNSIKAALLDKANPGIYEAPSSDWGAALFLINSDKSEKAARFQVAVSF
jgi:hypothetical protein